MEKQILKNRVEVMINGAEQMLSEFDEEIKDISVGEEESKIITMHLSNIYKNLCDAVSLLENEGFRRDFAIKYCEDCDCALYSGKDVVLDIDSSLRLRGKIENIRKVYPDVRNKLKITDTRLVDIVLDALFSNFRCLFFDLFKKVSDVHSDLVYWDCTNSISPKQERIKLHVPLKIMLCATDAGRIKAFEEFVEKYCEDAEVVGKARYENELPDTFDNPPNVIIIFCDGGFHPTNKLFGWIKKQNVSAYMEAPNSDVVHKCMNDWCINPLKYAINFNEIFDEIKIK